MITVGQNTPTGSRTPVFELRTRRPGPLDDGGVAQVSLELFRINHWNVSSLDRSVKQT